MGDCDIDSTLKEVDNKLLDDVVNEMANPDTNHKLLEDVVNGLAQSDTDDRMQKDDLNMTGDS